MWLEFLFHLAVEVALPNLYVSIFPGDHSEDVTPVPISNTEVKGLSGDGTAASGRGRVARCRGFFSGLASDRKPFFFSRAQRSRIREFERRDPAIFCVFDNLHLLAHDALTDFWSNIECFGRCLIGWECQ